MMRLLNILWKANIVVFSIVIPLTIIGSVVDRYEGHSKQPQQNHVVQSARSQSSGQATTTQYMTYLEAPASPKYYYEKPKPKVQIASYTSRANRIAPASEFAEPLTTILQQIIKCESNGNPLAKNPASTAKGLFQILDGTWNNFQCEGNVLDAEDNYQCGLKIAQTSGLHHWNASKSCWGKLVTVR
jgi:hypothetical protein